jgi:hypothetical protein
MSNVSFPLWGVACGGASVVPSPTNEKKDRYRSYRRRHALFQRQFISPSPSSGLSASKRVFFVGLLLILARPSLTRVLEGKKNLPPCACMHDAAMHARLASPPSARQNMALLCRPREPVVAETEDTKINLQTESAKRWNEHGRPSDPCIAQLSVADGSLSRPADSSPARPMLDVKPRSADAETEMVRPSEGAKIGNWPPHYPPGRPARTQRPTECGRGQRRRDTRLAKARCATRRRIARRRCHRDLFHGIILRRRRNRLEHVVGSFDPPSSSSSNRGLALRTLCRNAAAEHWSVSRVRGVPIVQCRVTPGSGASHDSNQGTVHPSQGMVPQPMLRYLGLELEESLGTGA